ncbi:hypothetical protein HID58_060352, partial [Brassica napus]
FNCCQLLEFGLKKADQQIILDDLNKHGPGFTWPSVSGAMPQVQGCVNEGEAVGRGAATSGFNNFIALTEAAKDLKDGTKLIYQIDAGGIQGHCWKKEGEAGKKCDFDGTVFGAIGYVTADWCLRYGCGSS